MSIARSRNVDAYLFGVNALDPRSILAGGGADGVAQTGNTINRGDLVQDALSASVMIPMTVNVSGSDTAAVVIDVEDSNDGSAWANFGTAPASVSFAVDGDHLVQHPLNLAGARQYIRVNATFTMSAGATDTAEVAIVLVQSGFPELPVTVDTSGDSF